MNYYKTNQTNKAGFVCTYLCEHVCHAFPWRWVTYAISWIFSMSRRWSIVYSKRWNTGPPSTKKVALRNEYSRWLSRNWRKHCCCDCIDLKEGKLNKKVHLCLNNRNDIFRTYMQTFVWDFCVLLLFNGGCIIDSWLAVSSHYSFHWILWILLIVVISNVSHINLNPLVWTYLGQTRK